MRYTGINNWNRVPVANHIDRVDIALYRRRTRYRTTAVVARDDDEWTICLLRLLRFYSFFSSLFFYSVDYDDWGLSHIRYVRWNSLFTVGSWHVVKLWTRVWLRLCDVCVCVCGRFSHISAHLVAKWAFAVLCIAIRGTECRIWIQQSISPPQTLAA